MLVISFQPRLCYSSWKVIWGSHSSCKPEQRNPGWRSCRRTEGHLWHLVDHKGHRKGLEAAVALRGLFYQQLLCLCSVTHSGPPPFVPFSTCAALWRTPELQPCLCGCTRCRCTKQASSKSRLSPCTREGQQKVQPRAMSQSSPRGLRGRGPAGGRKLCNASSMGRAQL